MDNEGAVNPEGFFMLKMMAEGGDFESQKSLAYMYFQGEDINQNIDQSLFWSNVAISHEECNEEEMLTISSRIGEIFMIHKDYEGALKKFTFIFESANLDPLMKDHAHAAIADAHYHLKDGKAMEIYEYIVNRQHPVVADDIKKYSYGRLGTIYMEKKDFKEAIGAFHKRVGPEKQADAIHLNSLGYANEMYGNFNEARKYYLLASEKGSLFANLNLGYLYDNGLGVEADSSKAFMYYEKGADCLEEWRTAREKFGVEKSDK